MMFALEEFLRAYAPVTMARLVQGRPRLPRLPDEGRRVGAAAVPGSEPRSGVLRRRRRVRHRPGREPSRRRSVWASIVASVPTSPGSSSRSRSRSSSSGSRDSSSPVTCAGASVRSAARGSCRSGCSRNRDPSLTVRDRRSAAPGVARRRAVGRAARRLGCPTTHPRQARRSHPGHPLTPPVRGRATSSTVGPCPHSGHVRCCHRSAARCSTSAAVRVGHRSRSSRRQRS